MSEAYDSLPQITGSPQLSTGQGREPGQLVPLFGRYAKMSEPIVPSESDAYDVVETDERPIDHEEHFPEVDAFIEARAAEFFGMKILPSTPSVRMRLIHKALQLMPELDEKTQTWVNKFEADRASKLGDIALHQEISIPVPPQEIITDTGATIKTDWTTRTAHALQAFRYPKVRDEVMAHLLAASDPAAYVITRLEQWRKANREQPKEVELGGSQRCYEQLLFGIWGTGLSYYTEEILAEKFNDLDIPG